MVGQVGALGYFGDARRAATGVDLIVRAAQDRAPVDDASLFAGAAPWPELTQMLVKVAPRRIGDRGRIATVALRAGPVTLKRPRRGFAKTDPETVSMTLVEAREINPPANEDPRTLGTEGAPSGTGTLGMRAE